MLAAIRIADLPPQPEEFGIVITQRMAISSPALMLQNDLKRRVDAGALAAATHETADWMSVRKKLVILTALAVLTWVPVAITAFALIS